MTGPTDIRDEWAAALAAHKAADPNRDADWEGRAALAVVRQMETQYGEDSYEAGFARSALAAWIGDQE